MSGDATAPSTLTVAIPCRADEPSLERVIEDIFTDHWHADPPGVGARELLVCINGIGNAPDCRPLEAIRARCSAHAVPLEEVSVDENGWPQPVSNPHGRFARVFLTASEGKARAWNLLRQASSGDPVFVCDADVTFGPAAFTRLYAGLAAAPELVLFSPKTDCLHDGSLLERILAVPYRLDFPNLSGQFYVMHPDRVPRYMPEDLIEPERWLELEVGPELVGRDPEARVYVRLTSTLADFFRQRVRIEMGKIQLDRTYPELLTRSRPQPGPQALRQLDLGGRAGLVAYLGLRTVAHAWAWWRYERGLVHGVWRQPVTTKQFGSTAHDGGNNPP
jgi:hypothetical protein